MSQVRFPVFLVRLTILLLLATNIGSGAIPTAASVPDPPAEISITATGFVPAELTVTVGTPVDWVNATAQSHTLVSGSVRRLYLPLILCGVSAPNSYAEHPVAVERLLPAAEPLFRFTLAPGERFTYTFSAAGSYPYYLADDLRRTGAVIVQPAMIPPDPATVAPPLDPTVPTTLITATEFLYTGANPIQIGVTPGTIDPERVVVLRGRVLDRTGQPISGVTINVSGHPEYGQTLTRLDGGFDLAANGGARLLLQYAKSGLLPVQRRVLVPWQDYVWLPDVVLIARDSKVSAIDLSASGMKAAQGSPVSDADGARQPAVLFPAGTTVQVYNEDGTTRSVSTLHLHMTEFTVGDSGPRAMPGDLPANTGYTYALDLGVAEATTRIAGKDVLFSQPVVLYEKNFLDFPVGGSVPLGYYDGERGAWVPNDNGRVVKIISITAGKADLDTDGDGVADNNPALDITDAEREHLAGLYGAGQGLWRMPIQHFSSWDANWPFGAAPGSKPPQIPTNLIDLLKSHYCKEPRSTECGSIVEIQDQALGEWLPLTGTSFNLHYASYRSPGRTVNRILNIPLSTATLPPGLKRIDLEITVAGRQYTQSFAPAPNLTHTFTWDGLDAYGRLVTGSGRALVRVGNVYDGTYQSPSALQQSFGYNGNGTPISADPARMEMTLWQEWEAVLAAWDARADGLGGWSLSPHHVYDPVGRILYYGDGSQRSVDNINQTINTEAGDGSYSCISMGGFNGDAAVPALDAKLAQPSGIIAAADGSYYFADRFNQRIRWVDASDIIHTVAGGGSPADGVGDGLPATQAKLSGPYDVAMGPDGNLYIADTGNNRIRRVGTDGVIRTVAGGGSPADGLGDGGLATAAKLIAPRGIAVGADGTLYIADTDHHRIRQVSPAGIIQTIAGTGSTSFNGDGLPGIQTNLAYPADAVPGPDGSVIIADTNHSRVRRLGLNGLVITLAQAGSDFVTQVDAAPDGAVFYAHSGGINSGKVQMLGTDGVVRLVAGGNPYTVCSGEASALGDKGPAPVSYIQTPTGIALTSGRGGHAALLISDTLHHRIRKVYLPMPGFDASEIAIPSADGGLLYRFDASGRHLNTLNALTGTTVFTFTYTAAGTLAEVADAFGNTVGIERNAAGQPTAIVAPFGQRTQMSINPDGYLQSLTDPLGQAYQLGYLPGGLLHTLRDRRGFTHTYTYDALGRLEQDQNPAGGGLTLDRTDAAAQYSVVVTSKLGLQSSYLTAFRSDGGQNRTFTHPDATQNQISLNPDESSLTSNATGMQVTQKLAGDPRFGMQAPYVKEQRITTPGGRDALLTQNSEATLAQRGDLLSVQALNRTLTLNGKTTAVNYDAASLTWRSTSPQARQTAVIIDPYGRPLEQQVTDVLPVTVRYDSRGRLDRAAQGARQATLAYDPLSGYLASLTDALGNTVSYARDAAGRPETSTLPGGITWSYGWDASSNLTGLTEPGGSKVHSLTYDENGRLASYRSPLNAQQVFSYELDGRPVRRRLPSGSAIEWLYNPKGQLATVRTPQGDDTLSYHPTTGLLSGATSRDGQAIAYGYDGGMLTSAAWSGPVVSTVSYSYNNDLRLAQASYAGTTLAYGYDNDGLLTGVGGITLARRADNGLLVGLSEGSYQVSYTHDTYGQVATVQASQGATLYQAAYTYDLLGRVSQNVETIGGASHTWGYEYDALGRLITVRRDGDVVESYSFDAVGNRTAMTNALTGVTVPAGGYSYDADHKLLSGGGASYTYDADGQVHTMGQDMLTYNTDGTLAAEQTGGQTISYQYDAAGRRVTRAVNGSRTHAWLYGTGLLPLAEYDGAGALRTVYVYAAGATPVKMIRGGSSYHVISDLRGSPRLVVDAGGAVVKRLDYDSFGNAILDSNPGFDLPFGFAGGMTDPAHPLVRFGARDYLPAVGRWTAKDPVLFAGGSHLYAYVGNDPVNRRDPAGLEAITQLIQNLPDQLKGPCPATNVAENAHLKPTQFEVFVAAIDWWLLQAQGKIIQGDQAYNYIGKSSDPSWQGDMKRVEVIQRLVWDRPLPIEVVDLDMPRPGVEYVGQEYHADGTTTFVFRNNGNIINIDIDESSRSKTIQALGPNG